MVSFLGILPRAAKSHLISLGAQKMKIHTSRNMSGNATNADAEKAKKIREHVTEKCISVVGTIFTIVGLSAVEVYIRPPGVRKVYAGDRRYFYEAKNPIGASSVK